MKASNKLIRRVIAALETAAKVYNRYNHMPYLEYTNPWLTGIALKCKLENNVPILTKDIGRSFQSLHTCENYLVDNNKSWGSDEYDMSNTCLTLGRKLGLYQ